MNLHTEIKSNPSRGYLPNGALYTQLALDTPEGKVEKLLFDIWEIPKPRLIMSITGGQKYFKLNDRLETNFMNGIIHVALKSDAWLITNGYNIGIVQLVGQAINKIKSTHPKKQITAIGICKWGSVKDAKELIKSQSRKKKNEKSNTNDNDEKVNEREHGERDLEMNHSHYLMLDDGTLRNYDIKDYRTRLCVHIAKLHHEFHIPTPVVTIVVEGGREAIKNIYDDLKATIPVVIINGSGRVADFFQKWLLYTKEFDDTSKYPDIAYEIDVTPVENFQPSTQYDARSLKLSNHTHFEVHLDGSKNTFKAIYSKYLDQLKSDLDLILTHDDDSKEKNRNPSLSTNVNNKREAKLAAALSQVIYCLQPSVRSGINVFNLNSDDDLSDIICRSICKSRQKYFIRKENDTRDSNQQKSKTSNNQQDQKRQSSVLQKFNKNDRNAQRSQLLQLAMDWNCIDAAKELILENSLNNILKKEEAFLNALKNNLPTFVYEFLKLGIDPNEIFFSDDDFFYGTDRYRKFIKDLYDKEAVNKNTTHLSWFIESDSNSREKLITTTDHLNTILTTIIGDYMNKLYFDSDKQEKRYRSLWDLSEKNNEANHYYDNDVRSEDNLIDRENQEIIQDYIMRDLFLWSILMNHIDMAKVLLCYVKYRICAALIATKILKEYHNKATHGELKANYMKNANYFQQYAINCISQCEKNDSDQGCQIVLQRIELYGNVTCIQIAANAEDKLFIATPCCVQALNNIWYDKIQSQESRIRNYILLAIGFFSFGLLAPFLVTYQKCIPGSKNEPLNRSLQSCGIDYSDPYSLEYPHFIKQRLVNQYMNKVKNFHRALLMKYCYHWMFYCFFLLLFSYVLLFNFQRPTHENPSIHWTEILTIIFITCMLIEEIHYFIYLDNLSFLGKCRSYVSNLFKIMNLLGFILFYIGLILRFAYAATDDEFIAARGQIKCSVKFVQYCIQMFSKEIKRSVQNSMFSNYFVYSVNLLLAQVVMAFDLEIWYLRSLSFIIVIQFLGPPLVAAGRMLKDLLFFMCIIFIVMTGYGVASRSVVYYPNPNAFNDTNVNTAFDGRSIFRQIAYPVYYLMYGQFGNELSDLDTYPDAGWSIATHILLAAHMLFVNILLINLLIAMFSKRFDQVYEDTKNIWHSQQYVFTREYFIRSPFFPPISLIYDIFHLCRMMVFAIARVCSKNLIDHRAKVFKIIPINKDFIKDWYEFEGASTYEYAHAEAKTSKSTILTSIQGLYLDNIGKVQETHDNKNVSIESITNLKRIQDELTKLSQSSEESTRQMQDNLARLNQSLEEIKFHLSSQRK
ncbi:unnamed protein product [Rotaria sordida]|uniref:Uncharacterized protein n=1 Tax=Rotaria sordida TaxID=392033 RepID=A0A815I6F5_9BILA|nr:unnamed protein product [Rotaria sordida]